MLYEIVTITGRAALLNSQSREHRYRTVDGRPLEPGIYLAYWPASVEVPTYDEFASYIGPFPSALKAGEFSRDASHGWSEPFTPSQGSGEEGSGLPAMQAIQVSADESDDARQRRSKVWHAMRQLVEKGWMKAADLGPNSDSSGN